MAQSDGIAALYRLLGSGVNGKRPSEKTNPLFLSPSAAAIGNCFHVGQKSPDVQGLSVLVGCITRIAENAGHCADAVRDSFFGQEVGKLYAKGRLKHFQTAFYTRNVNPIGLFCRILYQVPPFFKTKVREVTADNKRAAVLVKIVCVLTHVYACAAKITASNRTRLRVSVLKLKKESSK